MDNLIMIGAQAPGLSPAYPERAAAKLGANERLCLFVNGIFNSHDDARTSAQQLKERLDCRRRSMAYFYIEGGTHPVDLSRINLASLGAFVASGLTTLLAETSHYLNNVSDDTVARLAGVLEVVTAHRDLEVHAHSRGGLALSLALSELSTRPNWDQIRARLWVRTYGSVRLVDPVLATEVLNYFNPADMTVFGGRGAIALDEQDHSESYVIQQWMSAVRARQTTEQLIEGLAGLCVSYHADVDRIMALLPTLRFRCWNAGDTHAFAQYLEHGAETPQDKQLAKRVDEVRHTHGLRTLTATLKRYTGAAQ